MSKRVELIIEIDREGKIKVTPKGTVGTECLELMAFLDKIKDFNVLETIPNEDMGVQDAKVVEKVKDKLQ